MILDLDLAPLGTKFAGSVDQECATHDPHEFSPIQGLLVNDIEFLAELFVGIGQQVERKFLLLPEFLMRGQAIARHAKYDGLLAPEFCVQVFEIQAFLSAAGRTVFWIEVQDDILPAQVFESNGFVTRRIAREVGDDAIHYRSAQWGLPLMSGFNGFEYCVKIESITQFVEFLAQLCDVH